MAQVLRTWVHDFFTLWRSVGRGHVWGGKNREPTFGEGGPPAPGSSIISDRKQVTGGVAQVLRTWVHDFFTLWR
ncbi:MAG TPA: hypothetical protein PLS86_06940, partial [Phycisphaerae bacterium]|nr:hypothetical protein [Phycisphaerae bacterium]